MRRQIYGHGSACHVEMALNLGKLGECARARGELQEACGHFTAQRTMLESLCLREATHQPPRPAPRTSLVAASSGTVAKPTAPLQRIIRVVMSALSSGALREEVSESPPARLLSQLLHTIRWQRTVAREPEKREDPQRKEGGGGGADGGGAGALSSETLPSSASKTTSGTMGSAAAGTAAPLSSSSCSAALLADEAQQLQHAIEQLEAAREELVAWGSGGGVGGGSVGAGPGGWRGEPTLAPQPPPPGGGVGEAEGDRGSWGGTSWWSLPSRVVTRCAPRFWTCGRRGKGRTPTAAARWRAC